MDDSNLDLRVSPDHSSLALSWNDLAAASYNVECNSVVSGNGMDSVAEHTYSCSHSINVSIVNSTSKLLVENLIPGMSYNCCVSTVGLSASFDDCAMSSPLEGGGGGLAPPVVGLIGGVIGATIAVLTILMMAGITLSARHIHRYEVRMGLTLCSADLNLQRPVIVLSLYCTVAN